MAQFIYPYKVHPERTRARTKEEIKLPHRPISISRPTKRDSQRALVVNPAFQRQLNELNESAHEEDMDPTLMKAPHARGARRVTKRENMNVVRECEWKVKDSLGRRTSLNRLLAALVGVLCLTSIACLVLTLLILFGSVGINNCSCCNITGFGSTSAKKSEDEDRIEKVSENITTLERKMEGQIQVEKRLSNELRKEIDELRTLLKNQTAKQDKQAEGWRMRETLNKNEQDVKTVTARLESIQFELKTIEAALVGQIAGLKNTTNSTIGQLSELRNIWKAVNTTVEITANLTIKVDEEFKNVWRGVNESTDSLLSKMTSFLKGLQTKVNNDMKSVWFNLNETRTCYNNLTSSFRSFRTNVSYRSQQLESRIKIEELKSNSTLQLAEQHLNKIQSLGNSINSTRQDIKEVSQEHFKALWIAGNSTNAELRRVWTAVNSTQSGLLGQLEKVKDNLTNQLNLTTALLQSSDASLFASLIDVNSTITEKVNNVSKMAGPIGPPGHNGSQGPAGPAGARGHPGPKGAGDFSSCQYKVTKEAVTPGVTWASVTETEPNGKKFLGATCSTNFATEYNFKSQQQPSGKWAYVCTCMGTSGSFTPRRGETKNCYLHYWECPLTT
ncbi:hypothetical protein ACROYT_G040832 [Oculina patagonica]